MAQVEWYVKDKVWEHYLLLKSKHIKLWDQVFTKYLFNSEEQHSLHHLPSWHLLLVAHPSSTRSSHKVEISGAYGTESLDLFAEIARRVRAVTQEVTQEARAFLFQQLSTVLKPGNAASVLGSMGSAWFLLLGPSWRLLWFIYFCFLLHNVRITFHGYCVY